MRRILRLEEIEARTGVPKATLRWYRHRGEGGPKTWKLAGRVVAYEDEVEEWLNSQHAAAGKEGVLPRDLQARVGGPRTGRGARDAVERGGVRGAPPGRAGAADQPRGAA